MIDGLKGKPARCKGRGGTQSGKGSSEAGLIGGMLELKGRTNNSTANDTKAA